jgi:hypothetical protein
MATTSYSTDGAPVPAATTYPNYDAGSGGRSAVGAQAATSAQETTSDAQAFGGARMPVLGAPASPASFGCGFWCVVAVAVGLLAVSGALGAP